MNRVSLFSLDGLKVLSLISTLLDWNEVVFKGIIFE